MAVRVRSALGARRSALCLAGKAALPDLNATNVTEKATEVTQRAAGFVNTFRENFKKEMEAVRRTEKQPSTKPKP